MVGVFDVHMIRALTSVTVCNIRTGASTADHELVSDIVVVIGVFFQEEWPLSVAKNASFHCLCDLVVWCLSVIELLFRKGFTVTSSCCRVGMVGIGVRHGLYCRGGLAVFTLVVEEKRLQLHLQG